MSHWLLWHDIAYLCWKSR